MCIYIDICLYIYLSLHIAPESAEAGDSEARLREGGEESCSHVIKLLTCLFVCLSSLLYVISLDVLRYVFGRGRDGWRRQALVATLGDTPNLPTKNNPTIYIYIYMYTSTSTSTHIYIYIYTHTKIRWLKVSSKFPMDVRMLPLTVKIMLESNPLKCRILVRRLAARTVYYIISRI